MLQHLHISLLIIFFGSFIPTHFATAGEGDNTTRLALINDMYNSYQQEFSDIAEVSVDTLLVWLKSHDLVLLDVRETVEREVSTIPESIPHRDLTSYLEACPNQKIVVYCTIGYRSGKFARELQEVGIKAYNLKGGILAWAHSSGPFEHEGIPTKTVHVYGGKWDLLPESYISVW